MFKRKPSKSRFKVPSRVTRYDCAMFKGSKHGMILAYGVLEANGTFYEVRDGQDRSELTAKVVLIEEGNEIAYLPMSDFERYTVQIEYR